MKLKKFIAKILFFTTIVMLSLSMVCLYFEDVLHSPSQQKMKFNIEKITSTKGRFFETLIIGDSTITFAIMPSVFPNSAHLGQLAGDTRGAFYLLNHFLQNHPIPKRVILSFSFNTFPSINYGFWKIDVRGGFLSFEEAMKVYSTSRQIGGYPSSEFGFFGFWLNFLVNRYFPFLVSPEIFQEAIFKPKEVPKGNNIEQNILLKKRLAKTNGSMTLNSVYEPIKLDDANYFYLRNPKSEDISYNFYFFKILEKCRDFGIKIEYVIPPWSVELETPETLVYRNSYIHFLENVERTFTNVKVHGKFSFFPEDKMLNATHTNLKGGYKFSHSIVGPILYGKKINN